MPIVSARQTHLDKGLRGLHDHRALGAGAVLQQTVVLDGGVVHHGTGHRHGEAPVVDVHVGVAGTVGGLGDGPATAAAVRIGMMPAHHGAVFAVLPGAFGNTRAVCCPSVGAAKGSGPGVRANWIGRVKPRYEPSVG